LEGGGTMINPIIVFNVMRTNKNMSYSQIVEKANEYLSSFDFVDLPIRFITFGNINSNIPSAAIDITGSRISLNTEWLRRIVKDEGEEGEKALAVSLAHEMSHRLDYQQIVLNHNDRKFIKWINELFADYHAVQLALDGDTNLFEKTVKYKTNNSNVSKDYFSHPSWNRRVEYIKNYSFDSDFIRLVAKECNCNNQKLIDNVCNHFK
jgi:hypothetical protein